MLNQVKFAELEKKMVDIIQKETTNIDLNALVDKLMSEMMGREIEKRTQSIYPLHNVLIRKVKMLRTPKVDISKLVEMHGGAEELSQGVPEPVKKLDVGQAVGEGKKGKKGKAGKKGATAAAVEEEAEAEEEEA